MPWLCPAGAGGGGGNGGQWRLLTLGSTSGNFEISLIPSLVISRIRLSFPPFWLILWVSTHIRHAPFLIVRRPLPSLSPYAPFVFITCLTLGALEFVVLS